MNFDQAKAFLNTCMREELRDHAFGDAEITFTLNEEIVGWGYIGSTADVGIDGQKLEELTQDQTRELLKCGILSGFERNDSTGPDTFTPGVTMPGLTLEGVRKELTGE